MGVGVRVQFSTTTIPLTVMHLCLLLCVLPIPFYRHRIHSELLQGAFIPFAIDCVYGGFCECEYPIIDPYVLLSPYLLLF
jgi:hypothetical protein